ncbi:hypothetical protein LOZ61_005909 [Ophidiomyces ophidiicola]|nr:hypothetical protein LOZ61_005909 [Ophidiomyces ophidiicola]KAI2015911.1 hypothetical protein LOZ45_006708 [Ophidiomyces ophidiicola]KAI2142319.1 hypothetical protein LOZ27_004203 [Ophidiomyces ophidiicola]KAI2234140.1 hypothetical protein LOZ13_005314 [Ophidiomyces ophidiicola]KAI2363342.1 hypothetical protein LOY89_006861 [Ophidiomyces ophidiicola]
MAAADETCPRARALLLLPGAASPTFAALHAAYHAPLAAVLAACAARAASGLDLAVAVSGLAAPDNDHDHGHDHDHNNYTDDAARRRCQAFDHLQDVLAQLYRLLATAGASAGVALDGPGAVDTRVLFVDTAARAHQLGPVLRLADLAPAAVVYTLDTPAGAALLAAFQRSSSSNDKINNMKIPVEKLVCAANTPLPGAAVALSRAHTTPHYSVAVGGTFDHLHTGHKLLLTATLLALDPAVTTGPRRVVTIGITGDAMLANKKFREFLEPWEARRRGVCAFLQAIIEPAASSAWAVTEECTDGTVVAVVVVGAGGALELRFVALADALGPPATDARITALVVSGETRAGGQAVNAARAAAGLAALEAFEVAVLDAPGSGSNGGKTGAGDGSPDGPFAGKISSTELRRRQAASL